MPIPAKPPRGKPLRVKHLQLIVRIAKGEGRGEAAKRLGVSPNAVKSHVERMLYTTGCSNQASLVDHAYRHSLLPFRRILSPPTYLTPVERKTLEYMARGLSNHGIGKELRLSSAAATSTTKRIYARLSARNRAHAVAIGWQRGLLTENNPGECAPDTCDCP